MKTPRFLSVLCVFCFFCIPVANAQRDIHFQTVHWIFTPEPLSGPGIISNPCFPEVMTGDVDEILAYTKKTLHVYPQQGTLTGESGKIYNLDYNWNSFQLSEDGSWKWNLPMRLSLDGKLVAVLHFANQVIINGQGEFVVETSLIRVDCK